MEFHNFFSIEKKVKSTIFSIILFFQESEEEKEKMKMKKINFFIIEVTWTSVISLDSPILAHVEYVNSFPLREIFWKKNHVFCTRLTSKKRVFKPFFESITCRKLDYSFKPITLAENHLHIQHGQGLGNPTIPRLSI